MECKNKKRVAVIGSGISGLTISWLLSQKKSPYTVTLFERDSSIGMDRGSINVAGARVDVPLRVFSSYYYPNLTQLYDNVGIKYGPADCAFSCGDSKTSNMFFSFKNWIFGKWAFSLPQVGFKLFFELIYFILFAPKDISDPRVKNLRFTFGDYLRLRNYSRDFIEKVLFPALSSVCTCSYEAVKSYPAHLMLNYCVGSGGLFSNRRTQNRCLLEGGIQECTQLLTKPIDRVLTKTPVLSVRSVSSDNQDQKRVEIRYRLQDGGEMTEVFDQVVIASQGNHALEMLSNPTKAQKEALSAFKFEKGRLIVHRDPRVMPTEKKNWQPFHLIVNDNSAVTINTWCNRVDERMKKQLKEDVFQTWGQPEPAIMPDPSLIDCDLVFQRPVVDYECVKAQQKLQKLQGQQGIWFVGTYSRYSMPLLENGVESALEIAARMGVSTPWKQISNDEKIKPFRSNL